MHTEIAPEDRLCLLLSRRALSGTAQESALSLLDKPLRWELILERIQQHEVYPLAWKNLKEMGFRGVPDEQRSTLRALYNINAHRNVLLTEELSSVLRLLHQSEIPAIPLKGLRLAESLYGDISLRVCADSDILVPPGTLVGTLKLLQSLAYVADYPLSFVTRHVMSNTYEFPLHRTAREMIYLLEIHSGLFWEYSARNRAEIQIWEGARSDTFNGIPCLRLSPESEFMFLVIHAARHNWQSLKWLIDIHELCIRDSIDWEVVRTKAEEFGWGSVLRQTLGVCKLLLATPLPAQFSSFPLERNIAFYPAVPSTPTPFQNTLLCASFVKNPVARLRFICRRILVPTPRDAALCKLPGYLNFLYYLLRPIRLVYESVSRQFTGRGASSKATTPPFASDPEAPESSN